MLVNMRELLEDAEIGNYAVGSFSVANMEMVLGVLKAAEELNAPVILQIAEVRLKQSPLEIIGPLMVAAAENASTPVAVHFDHGKTIEKITEALDIGFTSVMFDILKQVDDMTDTPLVLHGGTGISPEDFVKCSKTGIKKINIATATFDSVENNVREAYKNGNIQGYYDLHEAEIEGAYKNAKRHILIFGSDNKA